jgi:hypothetical protein
MGPLQAALLIPNCQCCLHSTRNRVLGTSVQAGTSHNLGDNFARAFETQFLDESGEQVHTACLSKHTMFSRWCCTLLC